MYWSYVLMAIGVVGLYIVGSHRRSGWWVGIFAQVLWVVYAISTKQYGFIISAVVYAAVYARALVKFDEPKEPTLTDLELSIARREGYIAGMGRVMEIVDETFEEVTSKQFDWLKEK